jgi:hypothetical protein
MTSRLIVNLPRSGRWFLMSVYKALELMWSRSEQTSWPRSTSFDRLLTPRVAGVMPIPAKDCKYSTSVGEKRSYPGGPS